METMGWDDASVACADCGEPLDDPALERAYSFADDQVLCYLCAVARGGAYDEQDDSWVAVPSLEGLFPSGDAEFGSRGLAP